MHRYPQIGLIASVVVLATVGLTGCSDGNTQESACSRVGDASTGVFDRVSTAMQNFSAEPEESAHVLDDAAKDFRSGINGVTFAAVAEPAKALADALDDLSAAAAAATSKASDDSWMGDSDLLAARDRINNAASQLQDLCEKE